MKWGWAAKLLPSCLKRFIPTALLAGAIGLGYFSPPLTVSRSVGITPQVREEIARDAAMRTVLIGALFLMMYPAAREASRILQEARRSRAKPLALSLAIGTGLTAAYDHFLGMSGNPELSSNFPTHYYLPFLGLLSGLSGTLLYTAHGMSSAYKRPWWNTLWQLGRADKHSDPAQRLEAHRALDMQPYTIENYNRLYRAELALLEYLATPQEQSTTGLDDVLLLYEQSGLRGRRRTSDPLHPIVQAWSTLGAIDGDLEEVINAQFARLLAGGEEFAAFLAPRALELASQRGKEESMALELMQYIILQQAGKYGLSEEVLNRFMRHEPELEQLSKGHNEVYVLAGGEFFRRLFVFKKRKDTEPKVYGGYEWSVTNFIYSAVGELVPRPLASKGDWDIYTYIPLNQLDKSEIDRARFEQVLESYARLYHDTNRLVQQQRSTAWLLKPDLHPIFETVARRLAGSDSAEYVLRTAEPVITRLNRSERAFVHSDLHAGNILANGQVVFIDFERAGLREPCADLATMRMDPKFASFNLGPELARELHIPHSEWNETYFFRAALGLGREMHHRHAEAARHYLPHFSQACALTDLESLVPVVEERLAQAKL